VGSNPIARSKNFVTFHRLTNPARGAGFRSSTRHSPQQTVKLRQQVGNLREAMFAWRSARGFPTREVR
jgi:hypothetical protein